MCPNTLFVWLNGNVRDKAVTFYCELFDISLIITGVIEYGEKLCRKDFVVAKTLSSQRLCLRKDFDVAFSSCLSMFDTDNKVAIQPHSAH